MRSWGSLLALVLALPLAGCDAQTLIRKFAPAEESAIAERHLHEIRSGQFERFLNRVDPQNRSDFARVLPALKAMVPRETPKSVKLIGSRTSHNSNSTEYALTYEYEYSRNWLVTQIVLQRNGSALKITGVNFTPLANSVEHFNRFTLSGKGARHFVFLIAAPLILIFIVWTAITCWRTPVPKRKWLWMIFILLGLGSLTLNWTSGEVEYQVLGVSFLGVGFSKDFYGPLLLQISLPVGAAVFWLRRKKWLADVQSTG